MSDVTHIRVKTYSIHKTEDRNLKKKIHTANVAVQEVVKSNV